MEIKEIIKWKSKVQYKKNTPYISLITHLSNQYTLRKGNEVNCKLVMLDNKLKILIEID